MTRLPIPGADEDNWGTILNDYLQVSLAANGALKPDAVTPAAIQDASVSGTKLQDSSITATKLDTTGGVDGQVLTRDSGAASGLAWTTTAGSAPDADATTKGLIQLAGDLGGTASAPTVPGLAGKEAAIAAGLTSQYFRGDKSWQTLDKTAVGLANVDNTSDVNKPISTATQTALDGKVNATNGGGETFFDAGNSGTSATLNLANGNVQKLTLTGNCTITLTSPASGAFRSLLLYVFQDGTGSRTITWPASVKWGTAGAPTLSTGASKMDKILLDTVDGGTTWYGAAGPGGY